MIAERQHDIPSPGPQFAVRGGQRAGAGFAALLLFGVFLGVALLVLLLVGHIAQVPNAYDSGREYGSAPDTWAGTFLGVAVSTGVVFLTLLLLTGVGALLGFAATGRWLSRRGWIVAPSALTAVFVVMLLGLLVADRGSAQPLTDCDEFRFDRAAFVSTDRSRWEPQSRGLDDCREIDGLTRAQIVAKLGPAQNDEYDALRYHDGALVVEFGEADNEGRPVSVWAW